MLSKNAVAPSLFTKRDVVMAIPLLALTICWPLAIVKVPVVLRRISPLATAPANVVPLLVTDPKVILDLLTTLSEPIASGEEVAAML